MKKRLFLSAAVLLTACLVGVKQNLTIETPVEEAPVAAAPSKSNRLELPSIEGVKISVSNEEPQAGESVTLKVTNMDPTSRRVDAVKINGKTLEGSISGNTTTYEFVMPNQAAKVEVVAVNVYEIKVSEAAAGALTLTGIEGNVAAEGEVVQFRPATYAGNWYSGVRAVEEDVTLTPVEGKTDWYSFTMPKHAVTIDALTGKNIYKISIANNELQVSEDKKLEIWSMSKVVPNTYHEVGSNISFRIYESTAQYKVTDVKIDGQVIKMTEGTSDYEFVMPAYDVEITADYETWYRNVSLNRLTKLYNATVKTVITEGEETKEVDVAANNVVAGQEVRIYLEETGNTSKALPDLSLKDGKTSEDMTPSYTKVEYNEEGGYYFFNCPPEDYVSIELNHEEAPYKGTNIAGYYNTGIRGDNSENNYHFRFTETGKAGYSSTNSAPDSPLTSFSESTVEVDPNDKNHFVSSGYSKNHVFFDGDDTIFYSDNYGISGWYLETKDKGGSVASSSSTGYHSYTIGVGSSSFNVTHALFNLECANGEVITMYFDKAASKVYWDVTTRLASGVNGFTKDDILEVIDNRGNVIDVIKIRDSNSYGKIYADRVVLDGFEGVYQNSTDPFASNLELSGYGTAKIGSIEGTYKFDEGLIVFTGAEKTRLYVVNKDTMTYEVSTDLMEGTYTGELGDLVLDGYGAGTLNGEAISYNKVSATMVEVVKGEESTKYVIDKEAGTYVVAFYATNDQFEYTFVKNAEGQLQNTNSGNASSSAIYEISAIKKVKVSFNAIIGSEANYDKFIVTLVGTDGTRTELLNQSGDLSAAPVSFTKTLNPNEKLELKYSKDSGGDKNGDSVKIADLTIVDISNIPDAYVGTYTGELGDIVVDGFGKYTHNGVEIEYVAPESGKLGITIDGLPYELDPETHTYTKLAAYVFDESKFDYKFEMDGSEVVSTNYHQGNSRSAFEIKFNVAATFSFNYWVESEGSSYDNLDIYVNDTRVERFGGKTAVSGTFTRDLAAGDVLRVEYKKDSSGDNGYDGAKLTNICIDGESVMSLFESTTSGGETSTTSYVGTYKGQVGVNEITVVLNEDGTGTYGGTAFSYTYSNGIITITEGLGSEYELKYNETTKELTVVYDSTDYTLTRQQA